MSTRKYEKFPAEFRDEMVQRAIRYQAEHNVSRFAACNAVAQHQKCKGRAVFNWLKAHEAAKASEFILMKPLAAELNVTSRTLRFYEEAGLIKPVRRGQTRLFTPEDRRTISRILRLRELGFSIADIQREGLDLDQDPARLKDQEEKLRERHTDLNRASKRLERKLARFAGE